MTSPPRDGAVVTRRSFLADVDDDQDVNSHDGSRCRLAAHEYDEDDWCSCGCIKTETEQRADRLREACDL